jgi:DNA-methyltransferase (dcm)
LTILIQKLELALTPLAQKVTPEGSETKAVVHQWAHAIAYQTSLFAVKPNVKKDLLTPANTVTEDEIMYVLEAADLFKDIASFKAKIRKCNHLKPKATPKFTFIDLFAGIGGMRLGFQNNGGLCVFSSEFDKSAQKTYFNNHSEYPFGDITKIKPENIPDHDVLLAGFPCQPFSHAGVSARSSIGLKHGFECDTQGTLFFDIIRIALEKKPKILFLENVRNIERHDKGNTFRVIKESIAELGYTFTHQIIDSSSLVPQRRVRCYMVCVRKNLNIKFKFPEISGDPLPLSSILEEEVDDIYTISDRLWNGHINRTKRNIERGTGFTAHLADVNKPSKTIVARYGKDGKECLIPQKNKNPRMLTPKECAKLQGFPDEFIAASARTPAYKQFGNSVAVPVIDEIAKKIIRELI